MELISKKTSESQQAWVTLENFCTHAIKTQTAHPAGCSSFKLLLLSLDLETHHTRLTNENKKYSHIEARQRNERII